MCVAHRATPGTVVVFGWEPDRTKNVEHMPDVIVLARVLSGPPSLLAPVLPGRAGGGGVLALPSDVVAATLLFVPWACVFGRWARVSRSAHWHAGRLFARRVVARSRRGETSTWRRYVRSREQNPLLGFQLLRCTRVLDLKAEDAYWQAPLVALSCPNLRTMVWHWRRGTSPPVEALHAPFDVGGPRGRWHFTFERGCPSFLLGDGRHRGGACVLGEVLPNLLARRLSPLSNVDVTVWLPRPPEEWRMEMQTVVAALASLAERLVRRGSQSSVEARLSSALDRELARGVEACMGPC